MKLVHADLLLDIEIGECLPAVLVLENPKIMTQVVEELYNQCDSGDGQFILSEERKELPLEKAAEIIIDPFAIDFHNKKIQNKLFGEMTEASIGYSEEQARIQSLIIDYLDKIIQEIPYDMVSSDLILEPLQIFKMLNVRIEPQCESLLERLIEYTKIMTRIMRKDLLILVNTGGFLTKEELASFAKMCAYQKMKILFIENVERCFNFPVRTYIIDIDKCLIVK